MCMCAYMDHMCGPYGCKRADRYGRFVHEHLCICVCVHVCGKLRIWRANISVHIAVKGYVGAITPTGKDRAVLIATF